MSLITVRELRIGFRGPLLLDGVSCQIEPGQRIGLLGRNGAGKTTLLRILSGQLEPDGGGVVPVHAPTGREAVGESSRQTVSPATALPQTV